MHELLTQSEQVFREAWSNQEFPEVTEMLPGLFCIPVPMQANPLRYVMSYVFTQGQNAIVVDPGWPTDASWEAFQAGLETIGVSLSNIEGVIVTHGHTDHYGLVGRLQQVSGAWLAIHEQDAALISNMHDEQETYEATRHGWLQKLGLDEEGLLRATSVETGKGLPEVPVPPVFAPEHFVTPNQIIEVPGYSLKVHWTPGHSPGHICLELVDQGVMIAGDHLLPRITPNISSFSDHGKNALIDYLRSLEATKLLHLEFILPAHQWPFGDPLERIQAIEDHHQIRLDEIDSAVQQHDEITIAELARAITWKRPFEELSGFQLRAALGETLAHVHTLVTRERVEAVHEGTDDVIRFTSQR